MDRKFVYYWTRDWYDLNCNDVCLSNHPWLGNVIEVGKSAGKDRSMNEEVQSMSYSRRNKRPEKGREMDVTSY